jgi:energy-converting hydrogenase Eha subunit H
MSSIAFALLFGLLTGIAGFVGSDLFETVLMLGMLGLTHMSVVAARKANETLAREEIQRR